MDMGFWHLAETMGIVVLHDSGFKKLCLLIAHRSFAQTDLYMYKNLLCHEAKTLYFPNGHYEGPIDFFDQSFYT